MTWQERLKDAAYTSPSGVRLVFLYEDVSRSFAKKTSAFNFPSADGTYVQDLGRTGRKYPLRVILSGDDYDVQANAFEGLLMERGVGKLEHPAYGEVSVVPFGPVTRQDRLKTEGNQAIIEVTLWETIGLVYPSSQIDPASAVLSSVEAYNQAVAEQFAGLVDVSTAGDETSFTNDYQRLLGVAKSGLQAVADTQDNVAEAFETVFDSIDRGIDALISEPLDLAFQTTTLLQLPARAVSDIAARLKAYADLAGAIFTQGNVVTTGYDNSDLNGFLSGDVFAMTHTTGMVLSAVNNQFETNTDALAAADNILATFDEVVLWRDNNFLTLGVTDTGEAYQLLQNAVALAAGFLVQISFSLKQERRATLDRNRTMIDLVMELYGSVDDQLDFFIKSNNLSGNEILELPVGREVAYYV